MTAQTPQHPSRPFGRRRRALSAWLGAVVVAVTAVAWVTTTEGASAASTCTGRLVEHTPVEGDIPLGDDPTVGYVDIYYNASTGENCARAVTTGAAYGRAAWITVEIDKCRETSPSYTCTVVAHDRDPDRGDGSFHTYAGPVKVTSPHNCIQVRAQFAVPVTGDYDLGYYPQSSVNQGAKHCG